MIPGPQDPDLDAIIAVIARSQIVVPERADPLRHLPDGFDEFDLAILEWIAAEGRRAGRGLCLM